MNQCVRLGLGTVQWGMTYGIANRSGRPSSVEVAEMLRLAHERGVLLVDTAHAYGEAEKMLGEHEVTAHGFQVVTKTKPIQSSEITEEDVQAVTSAFHESLARLDCKKIYGLLVHHADTLLAKGGRRLWSALLELKAGGLIQKLGVSVYHPRQLENILNQNQIDLVQLPFNVYDQRFAQSGLLSRLTKMRIEVHARSVFLQGLLLMPPDQLPDGFRAIRTHHAKLHDQFRELGITPLQGALLYCLRQPAIDRIVVGCETADQLKVVLQACGEKMVAELPDLARFGLENDVIINPSVWRQ